MKLAAHDRVVVITGANEGIGYHLLTTLLENGYRVAGLDINGDQLLPLRDAQPDRVRYCDCDVTSDADVESAIEEILDEW